jgi:hypothetical protein
MQEDAVQILMKTVPLSNLKLYTDKEGNSIKELNLMVNHNNNKTINFALNVKQKENFFVVIIVLEHIMVKVLA